MSSVSGSSATGESDDTAWEVSEICAERTSISGVHQVLVVWKTCWIPVERLPNGGRVPSVIFALLSLPNLDRSWPKKLP